MTLDIAFVTRTLGYGGAERQLSYLAAKLQQRGHRVSLIAFYAEGPMKQRLLDHGVEIIDCRKAGRYDLIGFFWRLYKHLRQRRARIIHSYLPLPNVICAILKPFLPKHKLVFGLRASDMRPQNYRWSERILYKLERYLMPLATLCIANSHRGKAVAIKRGFPETKITVIHNALDGEVFQPRPQYRAEKRATWGFTDEHFIIGHVGRYDPMKGHDTMLRAFALVHAAQPQTRLIFMGGGAEGYKQKMTTLTHSLGIEDGVHFGGKDPELQNVYSGFDLYCLSSRYGEGFPNSLGEAMLTELPCVATDVGDVRHILPEGDGNAIVPVDDHEALAAALLKRLETKKHEQNRKHVLETFPLSALAQRTETTLQSLL